MIEVVCGIIVNDEKKVFAARRAEHKPHAGYWEFPGGKLQAAESPEQALQRELKEELGADAKVQEHLHTVSWKNKTGSFDLKAFITSLNSESLELTDHDEHGWFTVDELNELELMVADIALLPKVEEWLAR